MKQKVFIKKILVLVFIISLGVIGCVLFNSKTNATKQTESKATIYRITNEFMNQTGYELKVTDYDEKSNMLSYEVIDDNGHVCRIGDISRSYLENLLQNNNAADEWN